MRRSEWLALAGHRLSATKPDATIRTDLRRLLGARYARFIEGLGDEVPMRRVGEAMMGEGMRPGTLGYESSFFVLASNGAMFAVLKSGPFGAHIEEFGTKDALAEWDVRHRYLEFVDLDE